MSEVSETLILKFDIRLWSALRLYILTELICLFSPRSTRHHGLSCLNVSMHDLSELAITLSPSTAPGASQFPYCELCVAMQLASPLGPHALARFGRGTQVP
eukprot:3720321-Rhodomonas_salina.3